MATTLAETIKAITAKHLQENNGLLLGQAITAVGWVNNTVPDVENIVELHNADVAGSGIAVGAALAGRRPIFVLRYQDLLILNGSILIHYAAKSKELFNVPAPIFVRALATEGFGTGPVLSGKLHGIFMHFPGFRVWSPMTSGEYQAMWDDFMANDDPMIACEHRHTFKNTEELPDQIQEEASITLFGVSKARINIVEAAAKLEEEGIKVNVCHVVQLKPMPIKESWITALQSTQLGLVVDAGFEMVGVAQSLAYQLMDQTGVRVKALGLKDHTVGCTPESENITPTADEIVEKVKSLIKEQSSWGLQNEKPASMK